jgi:hypothetical protein
VADATAETPPQASASSPGPAPKKGAKSGGAAVLSGGKAGFVAFIRQRYGDSFKSGAMAKAMSKAKFLPTFLIACAARAWALDSGASGHIVNPVETESIIRSKPMKPVSLETVGEVREISEAADVNIPVLGGSRQAMKVEGSPCCASLGTLVEVEDCTFYWSRADGAWLFTPDGRWIQCPVSDRVPYLSDDPSALSADFQAVEDVGWGKVQARLAALSDEEVAALVEEYRATQKDYNATVVATGGAVAAQERVHVAKPARVRTWISGLNGKQKRPTVGSRSASSKDPMPEPVYPAEGASVRPAEGAADALGSGSKEEGEGKGAGGSLPEKDSNIVQESVNEKEENEKEVTQVDKLKAVMEREMHEHGDLVDKASDELREIVEEEASKVRCSRKKAGGPKRRYLTSGRLLNACRFALIGSLLTHAVVVDGYATQ